MSLPTLPVLITFFRRRWSVAILAAAAILINDRAIQSLPPAQISENDRLAHGWNAELVRLVSFGHAPVLVDLLLIRFLADDSMKKVKDGRHAALYHDLSLANELDPRFLQIPLYGATILTVVRDDHEGALKLIQRAERFRKEELPRYSAEFLREFWDRPWRVPLLQGYLALFEFRDFGLATKSFAELESYPDATLFHGMARKLRTREGLIQVAETAIDKMLDIEKNERRREALLVKREQVRVEAFLYRLDQEYRTFLSSRGQTKPSQDLLRQFLTSQGYPSKDPWGGTLSLGEKGLIETTTPREIRFQ